MWDFESILLSLLVKLKIILYFLIQQIVPTICQVCSMHIYIIEPNRHNSLPSDSLCISFFMGNSTELLILFLLLVRKYALGFLIISLNYYLIIVIITKNNFCLYFSFYSSFLQLISFNFMEAHLSMFPYIFLPTYLRIIEIVIYIFF